MIACAVWYLALVAMWFIPGLDRHKTIFMTVAAISAVLTTVIMISLGTNLAGRLEVLPDRIVLGTRTLQRYGLHGEIIPWKQAHMWTTLGSAIELRAQDASLRIGGRDHLLATKSERSTTQVDASLSSDDFVRFVRALALVPDPLASAADGAGLTIDLLPSSTSVRGMWRMMAPWVATMGIAGAVGMVASQLDGFEKGAALVVLQVLTVVIVLGGLAFTMRRNMHPPPARYRLRVEPNRVALRDLRGAGDLVDATIARPTATRLTYRYSGRGGTFEFPTLRLTWPSKSMVVGVWDTSAPWPAGTARTRRLDYLVGPAEWRRLVRELGIA